MEYKIIKDSALLKLNLKHQNFNETGQILKVGTIVNGEQKQVKGLRRGLPFTYRVTEIANNENKYIYTNNLTPIKMENVEVNSNAAGDTVIDVKKADSFMNKTDLVITLLGAAGGYFYAKKKGKNVTTTVLMGAAIGFGVAKFVYPSAIKVFKK